MANTKELYIALGMADLGLIEMPGNAIGITLIYDDIKKLKSDLGDDVEWVTADMIEGMDA